jgi:pSer/pThr/pTyr-binding forkhead associated (FHA) protein
VIRNSPLVLEVNGTMHPLEPPGLTVGRGSEADLRVNDPGVSRLHVEIRVDVEGPELRISAADLGSTNGRSWTAAG